MFGKKNKKEKLNEKLDEVGNILKKSHIEEITYLLGNKKQIFIRNLIAGVSRGVGIGIGVTLITTILVNVLQKIVTLNIPVIGEYVSDIIDIVKQKYY